MVLASLEVCGPILATVSTAIASADPAIVSIISFRMLGSPDSGVDTPTLLLTVGIATGALAIPKSRVGVKPLAANTAITNIAVVHEGFSGKTAWALKPLTEKPGKKKQEEEPGISLLSSQKRKSRKGRRRINVNEPTIGRLTATDSTDFTNNFRVIREIRGKVAEQHQKSQ
jgi:hypothetical protein